MDRPKTVSSRGTRDLVADLSEVSTRFLPQLAVRRNDTIGVTRLARLAKCGLKTSFELV